MKYSTSRKKSYKRISAKWDKKALFSAFLFSGMTIAGLNSGRN